MREMAFPQIHSGLLSFSKWLLKKEMSIHSIILELFMVRVMVFRLIWEKPKSGLNWQRRMETKKHQKEYRK